MNEFLLVGMLACSATPDPKPLADAPAVSVRYETRTKRVCELDARGNQVCRLRTVVAAVPVPSSTASSNCPCGESCPCGANAAAATYSEVETVSARAFRPFANLRERVRSKGLWFPGKSLLRGLGIRSLDGCQ